MDLPAGYTAEVTAIMRGILTAMKEKGYVPVSIQALVLSMESLTTSLGFAPRGDVSDLGVWAIHISEYTREGCSCGLASYVASVLDAFVPADPELRRRQEEFQATIAL